MRLIDADAITEGLNMRIQDLRNTYGNYDHYTDGFDDCAEYVFNAPAIDPESLRPQGEWELTAQREATNDRWNVTAKCTGCGDEKGEIWAGFFPGFPDNLAESISLDSAKHVQLSNYCPNCGAKMVVRANKDES